MQIVKTVTWKEDGRKLIYYSFPDEVTPVEATKGD